MIEVIVQMFYLRSNFMVCFVKMQFHLFFENMFD